MKKVHNYAGSVFLLILPFVLALFNGNCLKILAALFFVPCTNPGPGIDFTDSDFYHSGGSLYVTGNGRIYLSQDYCFKAGLLATIPGATRLNDVEDGFWQSYNLVIGDGGIIARSSQGSPPWVVINSGTSQNLNKMCVIPEGNFVDYIYAVGDNGTVIHSTNFGQTWTQKSFPASINLNDIECELTDTNNIRVVGDDFTSYYSTDGGNTWIDDSLYNKTSALQTSDIDFSAGGPDLNSVQFLDDNTGYIMGEFGVVFKTTNGGANFQASFIPGIGNITDMHFITADSGFIVSDAGQVRMTDNGGTNWYNDTAASNLFGGSRINGIASHGEWGVISADDGKFFIAARDSLSVLSYIEPVSSEVPGVFSLYQNFPNPFNPVTNIRFSLLRAGDVSLKVYNAAGKRSLHSFKRKENSGRLCSQFFRLGASHREYIFYSLTAGGFRETRKMMLVK